jgi:hypothetical protein
MKCYRTLPWATGAVTLLSLSTWACGGNNANATDSSTSLTRETLPSVLAKSLCEGLSTCCRSAGHSVDQEACESQAETAYLHLTVATTEYDRALAAKCVADTRSTVASCTMPQAIPSCAAMVAGKVALGGVCTSDGDCVQPSDRRALCAPLDSGATRACVASTAIQRATLGQPCADTCVTDSAGTLLGCGVDEGTIDAPPANGAGCYGQDGLYCDAATWTCQGLVEAGGSCKSTSACVDTARCDSVTQQCVAKGNEGSACTSTGSECVPGTYCDTDGLCQTKKDDGESCTASDECSGYCLISEAASSGTCASGRVKFVPSASVCQNYY